MDAGNTTAAGTRKHARAKQECRGWKGALWAREVRLTNLAYSLKKAFRPVHALGLEGLSRTALAFLKF